MVWVQRWATDARSEIDGTGMVDQRVVHFWDAGQVVSQPFLQRFGVDLGGLDYDFFLLFAVTLSGTRARRDRSAPVRP